MSTKTTIRSGDKFHLYTDWLDECAGADVVYLRLDDIEFEAYSSTGGAVTVELPRALAEEIGIPLSAPTAKPAPQLTADEWLQVATAALNADAARLIAAADHFGASDDHPLRISARKNLVLVRRILGEVE